MAITPHLSPKPRVLVVGGGYAGYNVAKRLQKKIRDRGGIVTVVEPNSYLTYQPFLPEVVGGSIEPRHAVVDLRSHLRQSEIVQGKIVERHAEKVAVVEGTAGITFDLPYQDVIVTAGADSRTFPIDGLGEAAIGLKRIEEAVSIRNQILERIESAALMTDAEQRRKALTFVVVGGGFAGAELIGEIEDLVRTAISKNPRLHTGCSHRADRSMGRIMPEVVKNKLSLWSKNSAPVASRFC